MTPPDAPDAPRDLLDPAIEFGLEWLRQAPDDWLLEWRMRDGREFADAVRALVQRTRAAEARPQPVRMVTCHTCQQETPSHSAYRCYDCGGWFDEEHAKEHFAKTTTSVRADVETRLGRAEAETARLREALLNLKRGACWCEVGIGNPMVRGVHSNACQRALDVLGASRPGEPQP